MCSSLGELRSLKRLVLSENDIKVLEDIEPITRIPHVVGKKFECLNEFI